MKTTITSRLREKAASRPPATPEKREGPPHLVVKAGAGTGKTTTLIAGLQGMRGMVPSDASGRPLTPSAQQQAIWEAMSLSRDARTVAFCAFNKPIATELQARVPPGAVAMTMHSLGNKAVTRAFGYCRLDTNRVAKIVEEILEQPIYEIRRTRFAVLKATEDLVRMVKMNLIPTDVVDPGDQEHVDELLQDLADYYDVNFEPEEDAGPVGRNRYRRQRPTVPTADSEQIKRQVFDLVPQVIARCKEVARDRAIDFNDMVYLPVALGLPVERYDLLLVDECLPGYTPVMLADGRSMTIRDIVESDERVMVRAYDTASGLPRNCLVTAKHQIPNHKPIVRVKVRHQSKSSGLSYSKRSFVTCTSDHKVWTINRGWVEAGQLNRADDVLIETAAHTSQLGKVTARGRRVLSEQQRGERCNLHGHIGGNGRGPTKQETTLLDALGGTSSGWQLGYVVGTGRREKGGMPSKYVIDIANPARKICIEVDGGSHYARGDADRRRDKFLEGRGWVIIRVPNYRVTSNLPGVLSDIMAVLDNCPRSAKVTAVESVEINEEYVYDITVEDCHNFYANGILVHNCQDLNRCQQALAKMSGRRLVFCGDDKQAIYGFAGADCESLPRLTEELSRTPRGVVTLPLMQSRRCAKAVVREAQKYAPDFDCFDTNPEGLVATLPFSGPWYDQVRDGDYLLCRVNAPLVSAFFRFISTGRRASILGRDLGANLVRFVRKLRADNVPDLLARADSWLDAEEKAEMARKFPREDRLASLQDKVACLAVFCQGETSVEGVVVRMEQAFTDNRESPGIRLSSVHKAKGLEARRVFLLMPKGAGIPHPMARTAWAREQENNILYIAITRARETFTYVREV